MARNYCSLALSNSSKLFYESYKKNFFDIHQFAVDRRKMIVKMRETFQADGLEWLGQSWTISFARATLPIRAMSAMDECRQVGRQSSVSHSYDIEWYSRRTLGRLQASRTIAWVGIPSWSPHMDHRSVALAAPIAHEYFSSPESFHFANPNHRNGEPPFSLRQQLPIIRKTAMFEK